MVDNVSIILSMLVIAFMLGYLLGYSNRGKHGQ